MAEYRNNYRQRENRSVYGETNSRRKSYGKNGNYTGNSGKPREQRSSQKPYYNDLRIAENDRNYVEYSKLRRKIMADDNVKYICSRNENVIHDKCCILARNIKDSDLKYLVNYPKWMKQCPRCAIETYIHIGALDPEKTVDYENLFKRMMIPVDMLRHMYVDCEMKTKVNGDMDCA